VSQREAEKRAAAERALALVRQDMVLGIGTGTTTRFFIEGLGRLIREGLRIEAAIPTSVESAELGRSLGLPIRDDVERPIDLAVDGADEIDPELRLVKGHGGALLREKLVATSAARFVVIADHTKLVDRVGRTFLPVEVVPFLWRHTARRLATLGAAGALRGGEQSPYRTDNGNLIVDLTFPEGIPDPERTAAMLKAVPGVVEHGLFLGLARAAIVAVKGGVKVIGPEELLRS
jgi:ribose 5-phosphate isomerase A